MDRKNSSPGFSGFNQINLLFKMMNSDPLNSSSKVNPA